MVVEAVEVFPQMVAEDRLPLTRTLRRVGEARDIVAEVGVEVEGRRDTSMEGEDHPRGAEEGGGNGRSTAMVAGTDSREAIQTVVVFGGMMMMILPRHGRRLPPPLQRYHL